MDEENEEDLIMYVESREIKETVWKVWDLLNDQEIVNKIILNSLLPKEIENMKSNKNILLDNKEDNNNIIKDNCEKSGSSIDSLYSFLLI